LRLIRRKGLLRRLLHLHLWLLKLHLLNLHCARFVNSSGICVARVDRHQTNALWVVQGVKYHHVVWSS